MRFEAKKIDLSIELKTSRGEEVTLEPIDGNITAKWAEDIALKFTEYEKENNEKIEAGEDSDSRITVIAKELCMIYGQDPDWWKSNFDFNTLIEVLQWAGTEMQGLGKSGNS